MSSGLRGNFGTMTKALHAGHASRTVSNRPCSPHSDLPLIEQSLKESWAFVPSLQRVNRITFKNRSESGKSLFPAFPGRWDKTLSLARGDPCCPGWGVSACPAARHQGQRRGERGMWHLLSLSHDAYLLGPRTGLEGKFSMEFCVAVALLEGEITPEKFTDEKVNQPEIRTLMKKVRTYVTKEVGEKGTLYPGALVKIIQKNGTSCSIHIKNRKGGPSNPLSKDEVVKKFVGNASALNRKDIDDITEKILQLEDLNDIRT